jgi:hypothetical protein
MLCPQCGARTQVSETRGPFRDRRCTNPACRMDFTTREHIMKAREYGRDCARTRATKIETPCRPPSAGVLVESNSEASANGAQAEQSHRQAGAGA